ncbi:PepSY-associated TM helix domain-containing protein [Acidovorax sp. NCPPB 4044]|uniref:PepSY-associated TM helix domain-containing protein n=1 Tax=Acidovorax sp. NCPPB 4044 TaxID=2940490 RepID=UPI002302373A|nr:PepSY-associated TM helix domain-containing protein [Acidovorax sp. NCPPB 4044]MDA8522271.1 PepSY domain-containing protein [Acidovorax sp. NCPPB 4044]
MTSQRTLSRLLALHSWAGIVTGLLLCIVCFSGAVVVFKNEIDLWANPSLAQLPRPQQPAPLDTVLQQLLARYPGATVEAIALPDGVNPAYFAFVREAGAPAAQRTKIALRPDTGAVVGPVDSQLGQYLRMLHVFLFFGPRWIVGFLGVAMLVLIGTGIVLHRKILAELFTQRWSRSLRVVLSDLHKSAGIWGLGFHLLIATTGAWLGLAPLFVQGWAYVASAPASQSAKAPPPPAPAPAQPAPSLDALHAAARQAVPGLQTRYVSLRRWGTGAGEAGFTGGISGHLASSARVEFDGAGRLRQAFDPRTAGFWPLVDALMEPLHFGDFGGLALKWLYFILGMTPAFLSVSGTLIWLDARRQRQRGAGPAARS